MKICPEVGLSAQEFRCGECKGVLTPANSRICDYSGLYYCEKCHFGASDATPIPARIIHNWDFTPRPVSRRSLQIINYLKYKPILFNITDLNSMLYGLVEELPQIKVRLSFDSRQQFVNEIGFGFREFATNCLKCRNTFVCVNNRQNRRYRSKAIISTKTLSIRTLCLIFVICNDCLNLYRKRTTTSCLTLSTIVK